MAEAIATATVRIIDPHDRRALRRYAGLERSLHTEDPRWVGQPDADVARSLSPTSAFNQTNDRLLLVAERAGKTVARAAAIYEPRYVDFHDEAVGFIGRVACAHGHDAALRELIGRCERWLATRGATQVLGPHNGAMFLGLATLLEPDFIPTFPTPWQPRRIAAAFEDAGYSLEHPQWWYQVRIDTDAARTLLDIAAPGDVVVRPIDKKRWDNEIETLRVLMNDGFANEWEFHPATAAEFAEFWKPHKQSLDPNHLLLAELDGRPVGWMLTIPDLNPAFRKVGRRLGPIGIARLIHAGRNYKRALMLGTSVSGEAQRAGVASALAIASARHLAHHGITTIDAGPINEHNTASRGLAESLGATGRRVLGAYGKHL